MDMRLLRGLLAAALCLCAASAAAADFDYDWVSTGVLRNHSGGLIEHGGFVDGSYAVGSQFTVQGSFYQWRSTQGEQFCSTGTSANFCDITAANRKYLRVGAGWHWSVADSADLLADAYYARNWLHEDFEEETFLVTPPCPAGSVAILNGCAQAGSADFTGSGYQVDVGVRIRCSCTVEFKGYLSHAGLSHVGLGEGFGSANIASAEAAWRFTGPWTLVVDARHSSTPTTQYRVGMRYQF